MYVYVLIMYQYPQTITNNHHNYNHNHIDYHNNNTQISYKLIKFNNYNLQYHILKYCIYYCFSTLHVNIRFVKLSLYYAKYLQGNFILITSILWVIILFIKMDFSNNNV